MSLNTEGATGSNKRRRWDDDDAAATSRAAAANPTTIHQIGKRLEPIKDVLASQPAELKGTIISSIEEMLDCYTTYRQKQKSLARFDQPMKDATTGVVVLDEEGNPKPFIPNPLRKACPVKAPKRVASKNDDQARALEEEAKKDYAEYIAKATATAKKYCQLDTDLCQEELFDKFYTLTVQMSLAYTIVKKTMKGGFTDGMKLDQDELANKIAYDIFHNFNQAQASNFGMESGEQLAQHFAKFTSYDHEAAVAAWDEAKDGEFVTEVALKIKDWIPRMTFELWAIEEVKDRRRQIDAELRKALKPKAMAKANQDVEDAMDTEDANQLPGGVIDMIRKETKKTVGKEVQKVKASLRKKSTGDGRAEQSTPANGRKSGKDSKTSRKNSKKNSKAGSGTPRSILKKGNQVKFTPPKANRPSRKQGKADGANRGGKRNGAGRR